MKDLQLINIGGGLWEPSIDVNDAETVEGFETAIIVSIFTNARADESEKSEPINRGGWWGNALSPSGYELGSRNWLLEREKITNQTTRDFQRYTTRCLKWLLNQKVINALNVGVKPDIKKQKYIIGVLLSGRNGQDGYAYDWSKTDARKITKNIGY